MIIQMELFDLNLKTFLRERKTGVQVDVSLRIFLDILAGMAQLHTRRDVILHRDLKPTNIFLKVSNDGRIMKAAIGDFGLSTDIENGTEDVGTAAYAAPEQKSGLLKYDEKVDVYSLGLILFELFNPP